MSKKNNGTRNPYVVPMNARCKSATFKDRREVRGGSKNDQTEFLSEVEDGYGVESALHGAE